MGPFDWVASAIAHLVGARNAAQLLAGLPGQVVRDDPEGLLFTGSLDAGFHSLRVARHDGTPEHVSVDYAPGSRPAVADAARVLGPWHEYPRLPGTPCQGSFAVDALGCRLVGTTLDPPGDDAARELLELTVLRPS